MLSKYLAPTLAAAVLLTGLTALPAQAEADSTPASTATAEVQQPTEALPTVSPSAESSAPTPEPTATGAPTPSPSVAPQLQRVAPQQTAEPTPAPTQTQAPAPVLKNTVSTGSLQGKKIALPKLDWTLLSGTVSVDSTRIGRSYQIEIYNSKTKKWSTLSKAKTDSSGKWYSYLKETSADSQTLRLVVPSADKSFKPYTGPATTVKRTKSKLAVYISSTPGTVVSVPWEQKYFKFSVSQKQSGMRVELQKRVGNKWNYVSKLTTNSKSRDYQFKLPRGNKNSKNTTQGYRVAVNASTYYDGATSKQINARWENPYRYSGSARKAYGYIASRCSTVLIRMDGNLHRQGRWGEASIGADPGVIKISTQVPAKHLQTVALHECSHFTQYATATNKNNRGWDDYKAKANRLFGTKGEIGMERVNECMAASMGPHSYWSYGASPKLCGQTKVKNFSKNTIYGKRVG